MAFCRYCGTQIEDGKICSCPQAQQAAAQAAPQVAPMQPPVAPVQPPVAPAAPAAPNAISVAFKNLLPFVKSYVASPKAATKELVAKKDVVMASIFAAFHMLISILFFVSVLGTLKSSVLSIVGVAGSLVSGALNISLPVFPLILSGIVAAAVTIGLSTCALVVVAKLSKTNFSFAEAYVTAALGSFYPSVILVAAMILSLISGVVMAVVAAVALVVWAIVAVSDVKTFCGYDATVSTKNEAILTVVFFVVILVAAWIAFALLKWDLSNIKIAGQKVGDAFSSLLSGMMSGDLF